jgi:hypothetical protein
MSDAVADFLSYHTIDVDEWPWGRVLLSALLNGKEAALQMIADAPASVLNTEPAFGVLCHLTERAYEHVAGSIACYATRNAATAEVAARAAVELTISVRFLVSGDRNSRVLAWLRDYIRTDEKQINQWEQAIANSSERERQQSIPRIATRRKLQEFKKSWLDSAEREFGTFGPVNLNELWPRIIERFEQAGEAAAYRTVYARLSSQTHADAEDTLSLIFFQTQGQEGLLQMAEETVAFTQYLMGYSAFFYLVALKSLSETFKLGCPKELDTSITATLKQMGELADQWKW